jgi:hypothetical protein
LEVIRVQYSPRAVVDFLNIPDCLAIEWIPNREIRRTDPLGKPTPGEITLRGTIYTYDPNIIEKLIDLSPLDLQSPEGRLRFDYRAEDGTYRRKTMGPVIFGTAGSFVATVIEQPPNSLPRANRISFVLSIPEGGTLASVIKNETVNLDGSIVPM